MRWLGELMTEGRGRVLVFCWLGWVFDFYDLILFAFVQSRIADDLSIETGQLGWLIGWTLAATAVGGFALGRLADRWGRRKALTLSILIYSGGVFATALADGFWTLLVARLVTGFGVGGEWGVGHAIIAETYPERLRNRAAACLQAGAPLAMALAAAVGCFVAPWIGWRACFMWSALPALLALAARWAIPGEDRAPGRTSGSFVDLFRGAYLRPSAALLGILILHMTGFWCTYAWLPSALLREANVSLAFVGWFQIGINSVHVFADVAFGFVADRFGRRRAFVGFCLLFAVGVTTVALGFERLRSDVVLFGFAMAAVGLGAGTWSCFGVMFAECYRPDVRATAASGFYNLSRGVQLLTQPFMAWCVVVAGSFSVGLWVGAATALLSACLIGVVRPPRP